MINKTCMFCDNEMKLLYNYPETYEEPHECGYECENCGAKYKYSQKYGEYWNAV